MSRSTINLTPDLHDYLLSVTLREPEVFRDLREETGTMEMARMQISPEQGQFMYLLVKLMGAKRTLEIGTFTGYSALWTAMALPEDGTVVACDVSEEWTRMAQEYWQKAGVAEKIDLRIAPADETLQKLIESGEEGRYDFAFIDADKTGYDTYYEQCLQLLRPGGLIIFDNVLRRGRVLNENSDDENTVAMRALNEKLHQDDRIDLSMLPLSDGLTLALKR
ncbi:MAG: class I SAM-dependent methyltransferase [Candidatus Marinimicrobia bacterium]|nr:class I SAM-dependent methyltransferase [Candidatus Neomarinimicrobiota bacterium]MCF7827795.1 class I SAM-dependent methyltransferase [Candidatus Neomarinimicrobiota bacterium]MCF7879450.1 class I SAM-dependent methyltransferase [Candidatus Neomarinimicrobiota bacterium]